MSEPTTPKPPPPVEPTQAEPAAAAEATFCRRCDIAARIVLSVVMAVGLCTFPQYGVTTDEPIRAHTGENWWRWLATGEPQYLPENRLRYYGALFDMIGVKASELWMAAGGADPFTPKHLLCFLTMWLGLLGTYKLAGRMAPQPLPLIALLVLALMPRFYGSFNNPKDIPFAAAFVWAVYALVGWVRGPNWKTTLLFAVCAGLATAVRPFGILFLPVGVVCGLAAWWAGPARPAVEAVESADAKPAPSLGPWIPVFAVGALGFSYLFWPTLWVSSPWHLPESLAYLSKFPDGGASQYFGEVFNREQFAQRTLPIEIGPVCLAIPAHVTFIPVWTAITIPAVTLALMLAGLGLLTWWSVRGGSPGWAWWLAAAWLLLPWLGASIRGSNYSRTARHFMFMFPAIALFAALTLTAMIDALRRRRGPAWLPAVIAGVLYAEVLWTTIRLFPYESLYFSHIVGGIRGVAGDGTSSKKTKFDIENWSQSYAEAFAWLAANCDEKDPRLVHVHAVQSTDVGRYHARQYGMQHNTATPRYFISMWIQGGDERFPGEVIHTVQREGVPLSVVKRITPLVSVESILAGPADAANLAAVGGRDGGFDLSAVGVQVPLMTSLSAEDNTGTKVRLAWSIRSDEKRTLPLMLGFKGPGKVRVNGKDYAVGDRLRFLPFDAFAGLVRIDVELVPGVNRFTAEAEIRHDPRVYIHWPRTDGVQSAPPAP